jgi:hypothetical protein
MMDEAEVYGNILMPAADKFITTTKLYYDKIGTLFVV